MINKHRENDITYSSPSIHYILYILSFSHTCLWKSWGQGAQSTASVNRFRNKKDLTVNSIIYKYFFFTCYAHII